jgi:purine-binding chemotaxis protein CheW
MTLMFDNKLKSAMTKSFLSFKLGSENFAINVMKIMEILEVTRITKVPHAPGYLIGVVNLRGGVLPVIDTRIKFGMAATEFTVNTCIVVLNVTVNGDTVVVGAMVDSVSKVFEIEESQIQPSPSIGARYQAEFVQGMINEKDQFMMLLDIDKVFSTDEIAAIKETNEVSSVTQ